MAGNELTNIQVYRKKWNINIGIILFGVVFIYLAVTVLIYLTNRHVSPYEVREGSIFKDNAYTGIVLRTEAVINADSDGYINYFAPEGSKVGAKTKVFTLSQEKLKFSESTEEGQAALSSEEQAALLLKTQSFSENYTPRQFQDVYTLKDTLASALESKSSQSRQVQLDAMAASGAQGLNIYTAADDGVIIYSTDGYENLAPGDVTEDIINKKDYQVKSAQNNTRIKAGSPAYKLITDDNWTLVILLDHDTSRQLADTKSVKIRFTKDNETVTADLDIYNKKDYDLGYLTIHSSMVRYAKDRYLDVELILKDESGLKIPKSSVITEQFWQVPEGYLTQGGNSKEAGVLVDEGGGSARFRKAVVYGRDSEKELVYLDTDEFDSNTVLIKPDSSETYKLGKTKRLKGVYNINRGYAVFRKVDILCESDEYYIVQSASDYGLSNYDHIALDGKAVRENDVVF